jgi:hypothetical protein
MHHQGRVGDRRAKSTSCRGRYIGESPARGERFGQSRPAVSVRLIRERDKANRNGFYHSRLGQRTILVGQVADAFGMTHRWREMDSNHRSPVGGQHFSRPPFGRSGLALPRGRRSVPPKRRGRSAVDEVGLIDIVGRWNSSLNINLTPVVDDEDRLPFAWAGQATLDHVRRRNCGARRSRYRAYRRPTGRHRRAPAG